MDLRVDCEPRPRTISLPDRGGAMAALEFGPQRRPIDIVFSHATGFNARTYRTILGPLAASLRILALDLRGHGATTLPADPDALANWNLFAEDLAALLKQEIDRPVVLAGHSLGGIASVLCAVAAPERVRAVTLLEPVLLDRPAAAASPEQVGGLVAATLRRRATFPDHAAAFDAYRGRGAFTTWQDAQLADYLAAGLRVNAEGLLTLACAPAWEAAIYSRPGDDPIDALGATSCPVRILAGDGRDSTVGARAKACARDAGARLDVVAGASHFLPMERPDLVREVLRELAP